MRPVPACRSVTQVQGSNSTGLWLGDVRDEQGPGVPSLRGTGGHRVPGTSTDGHRPPSGASWGRLCPRCGHPGLGAVTCVPAMSVSSPSDAEGSPCPLPRGPGGEEAEEEKVCAVCGDRATGYHFHVMTCEGCKGFFRRSINKGVRFTCPFARSCPVTKAKRRQCQACRLQKCLDVGMRKDMIMSEEALQQRRALRGQRRVARDPPAGLTAEQQELIDILIAAHQRTFDSSFSQFTHYWVSGDPLGPSRPRGRPGLALTPWPLQPAVRLYVPSPQPQSPLEPPALQPDCLDEDVLPDVFSMLPHFADLSTFMIQQVISFAKEIPVFRTLPIDDQISLLKGATLEICQIQFNTVFNAETKAWECGQHCYTIQDGALAGFQQIYLEPLLKFHISLKKLQLHEAEYVLLQAMRLFSPDHAGVAQRDVIDQFQEKVALTLKSYIDHRHPMPGGRFLYAKLLLLLTELQTLKMENTRQILHIQDLSSMTPLLSEIIS
ncbi:nuclear receptor subfamily 1 group I member 3 [Athene noctua]|uniref:nuclear receptor subfamily 1 group I member 3 n=1 Tax=Athene noctua TaxID=126797 RepID=UPI003EC080FE